MSTAGTKENKNSENAPVKLTKALINQYRKFLEDRGCSLQTISMYFCYLNRLYDFLPGDKEITEESLKQWVASLKEEGYSDRTINMHISTVNGFLRFCGDTDALVSVISVHRRTEMLELSRDEYLQLLSYVKNHESERDYLLIKTLATIGIGVSDLPYVTAEACRKGVVDLPNNREIMIPESFKQELLAYCKSQKLKKGSLFITKNGNTLDRANIIHHIRQMGERAGIEKGKCSPSTLHRLYEKTQKDITEYLMSMHTQVYEKLLDEEKKKVS